jgi:hypothetical protein
MVEGAGPQSLAAGIGTKRALTSCAFGAVRPANACGTPRSRSSSLKRVSSNALLARLWTKAADALRLADDVIVIGYRLHQTDTAAQQLFTTSLLGNTPPTRRGGDPREDRADNEGFPLRAYQPPARRVYQPAAALP